MKTLANPLQAHLIIMGVSGCGKSTIAELLAARLGREVAEADAFHPQSNVAKMQAGTPLTDEDRWPWLELLRQWLATQSQQGQYSVMSCSALRRIYRDKLADCGAPTLFVHLDGDPKLIEARMRRRLGHFMPSGLLPSQLATLEPIQDDEYGLVIDVTEEPSVIVDIILKRLGYDQDKSGAAT